MTITEQIDAFIAKEGNGSVRDALNVALARLEQQRILIESIKNNNPLDDLPDNLDDYCDVAADNTMRRKLWKYLYDHNYVALESEKEINAADSR